MAHSTSFQASGVAARAPLIPSVSSTKPGFTLSTGVCTYYYANGRQYPTELKDQVAAALKKVEEEVGGKFGSTDNTLLLSCRSGARESMPGMMDTILNIGLNDTTVVALAKQSGNERFAWDSYRRLI